MKNRVHLFGAAGSGTTSIGRAVAQRLACPYFDTDSYYFYDTAEPFTEVRPIPERLQLLRADLEGSPQWVLGGSLHSWGCGLAPLLDLAVFITVPHDVRMARLRRREAERYGERMLPGGNHYEDTREFLEWAAGYDDSSCGGRTLKDHLAFIETLHCPVLRLDNSGPFEASVKTVLRATGE